VRFEVQDTGIGVTAEQLARLFQPFAQADASTTRRYGGTGLGLNISRRLVQLMGGDISVTSAEGEGSTFSFSLALPPGVEPPLEVSAPETNAPARVLLVDDNEINLKLERALLERGGHTVTVARNGEEALTRLGYERFDLVLLDLQMPVLDGFQTARRVRDAGSAVLDHAVPIVALTANATVQDRQACEQAGFSDYLTKPVAPRALMAAVARWRGAVQQQAATPEFDASI
jgi:CheY-like chemotaxis protein